MKSISAQGCCRAAEAILKYRCKEQARGDWGDALDDGLEADDVAYEMVAAVLRNEFPQVDDPEWGVLLKESLVLVHARLVRLVESA